MRKVVLVVVMVLGSAVSAMAQAHPCDEPPQTVQAKGTVIGWCHDRKDAENLLYQQGELGFKVILPGQVIDLGSGLTPIGAPSASGEWYFQASLPNGGSRGTYSIAVSAYSAEGESLPSTSIVWQIGGPPSIPKKPRIK